MSSSAGSCPFPAGTGQLPPPPLSPARPHPGGAPVAPPLPLFSGFDKYQPCPPRGLCGRRPSERKQRLQTGEPHGSQPQPLLLWV